MPGAYPATPQPPPNAGYQTQQYNQAFNAAAYRGATPLPYPGTPQPYQMQQQQSLGFTGPPQPGFIPPPPRLGPSPGPMGPPGPNLAPGFTPRPQSWVGPSTPAPPMQLQPQRPTSAYGMSQMGAPPVIQHPGAPGPGLQQGLQAISAVGIQAPPPNPHWVNGATPPTSRPASATPAATRYNIDNSVAGLTFNEPPPRSSSMGPPQLTVQLPNVQSLSKTMNGVLGGRDPASKVAWCKDVFSTLDRAIQANGSNVGESSARELLKPYAATSPAQVESDNALLKLGETAVMTLVTLLTPPLPMGPNNAMPPYIAEALFLRGQVIAAGSFPEKLPKSPRDAFRDFEASARGGYAPAWFKLGRDYETVGDLVRAKDCFERGVQRGVGSCFYRMGMAHLQGQLNMPQNPAVAMPLLQRAAFLSSIEVPQPAYVYALLLMQEFPHITLPVQLLQTLVPPAHPYQTNPSIPPPSLMSESRKYLERSAYLGFGPALYKLGQSYEHALPPFHYDPLMSVQYYSLASQQGDPLADLALSKWFLVGSNPNPVDPNAAHIEGFDKDESLAIIFAEKAAAKGEAGGEFAMGYYSEVGIGRPADLQEAKVWYERAAKQNHAEAIARLKELARENPTLLGVQEARGRLERMRTSAMQRSKSNASNLAPSIPDQPSGATLTPVSGANVIALARTSSRMNHPGTGRRPKVQEPGSVGGGGGSGSGAATLAPPGATPAPAPAPTTAPTPAAKPTSPVATPSTSPGSSAGKKPMTFEEMGYHSQKLEDKECIIM